MKPIITQQFRISDDGWHYLISDMNLEVADESGNGLTIDCYDDDDLSVHQRITFTPEDAIALREVLNRMKFKGE